MRVWPDRRLATGLSVAAVIGAALMLGVAWNRAGGIGSGVRELTVAARGHRLIEPRLVGFDHAVRAMGRAPATSVDVPAGIRLAAAILEKRAEETDTPDSNAARAVALLVTGDVDRAIRDLEDVTGDGGDRAFWWSDLSAAYLVRSESNRHADDVVKAIEAADHALDLDPALPTAMFNRALALEQLPLLDEALAAWDAVLAADSSSGWGHEAREHRQHLAATLGRDLYQARQSRLTEALASGDTVALAAASQEGPQNAREIVEERLAPAWATAYSSASDREVVRIARDIATIGQAISSATGDDYLGAIAKDLESCSMHRTTSCDTAAAALTTYDAARRLYDADRFAESDPLFAQAAAQLQSVHHVFAIRALFQWAVTQFYQREFAVTARTLDIVLKDSARNGFGAMHARALWMRGLMRRMPDEFEQRIGDHRDALADFERIQEGANVSAVHVLLAETYSLYGDYDQAWAHRRLALRGLNETGDRRRRHAAILDGVRASLRQGFPRTAAHFDDSLLAAATAWKRPAALAEAYVERARIALALERRADGAVAASEALRWLAQVPDDAMRQRLTPFALSTVADVAQHAAPDRALATAAQAGDLFRAVGARHHLLPLARLRAQTMVHKGQRSGAIAELSTAIEELDSQRRSLDREAIRISYTAEAWSVFRDLIALTVDENRSDLAFQIAERGRARDILDAIGEPEEKAPSIDGLQRSLHPGTLLIAYVVLDDELLAWSVAPGSTQFARQKIGQRRLLHLVSSLQGALQRRDRAAKVDQLSRELYSLLLGPFAGGLDAASSLVLVADDVLAAVPFAALVDRRGRFVVESHVITTAPSVRVFTRMSQKIAADTSRPQSGAIVCDCRLDTRSLPHVGEEVRAIETAYGRRAAAFGAEDGKQGILAALGRFDVIHFATHGVENAQDPEQSRLIIPARDGHDVSLFASELGAAEYPATRIAVLAACRSAAGVSYRGSSALSLARPFLKKAVPAVVAALWEVDDAATARLFAQFHRELATNGDAAAALQLAQVSMIRAGDPTLRSPVNWAAFVVLGGHR